MRLMNKPLTFWVPFYLLAHIICQEAITCCLVDDILALTVDKLLQLPQTLPTTCVHSRHPANNNANHIYVSSKNNQCQNISINCGI